jgi:hypothetical protein
MKARLIKTTLEQFTSWINLEAYLCNMALHVHQEHKLQEKDIPDMEKLVMELLPEYKCHWAWSMDKKGYCRFPNYVYATLTFKFMVCCMLYMEYTADAAVGY